MKTKLILSTAVIALALLSQSCKKHYECHCDKKAGGSDHIEIEAKKSDAEAECTKKAEGTSVYSSCKLE